MRLFGIFGLALLMSGCFATTGNIREINSDPPGALVTVEGLGECETPCTVQLGSRRSITVAKAGYTAQRFDLEPEGPAVNVLLELAAPTDEVDAETLPDIQ